MERGNHFTFPCELANLERLQREFRGEDPATSKLDLVDVFFRMATMAEAGEL
jgi:hypothetical protein